MLLRIIESVFRELAIRVTMVVKDRLKELQEKSKYYKDGQVDDIEMKPLNSKDKLNMQPFVFRCFERSEGVEGAFRVDHDSGRQLLLFQCPKR